jgi:hypothetical protein
LISTCRPAHVARGAEEPGSILPSAHPNRQLHAAHPPPKRAERRATSDQPVDCAFATIPVVIPRMLVAQAPALAPAAPNGRPSRPPSRAGTGIRTARSASRSLLQPKHDGSPFGADRARQLRQSGKPESRPARLLYPRRNWGVFAVRCWRTFGDQKKVVWTIKIRGQTFSVPGACARNGRSTRSGRSGLQQHAACARL